MQEILEGLRKIHFFYRENLLQVSYEYKSFNWSPLEKPLKGIDIGSSIYLLMIEAHLQGFKSSIDR